MSKHNPNAWQDGFDAWQNGYNDAMYDGIDTSSEMPCKCEACMKAYDEGQQEAIKEIFGRGQSAQQTLALDGRTRVHNCDTCQCEICMAARASQTARQ